MADFSALADQLGVGDLLNLLDGGMTTQELATLINNVGLGEVLGFLGSDDIGSILGLIDGIGIDNVTTLIQDYGGEVLNTLLDSVGVGEITESFDLNGLGALGDILSGNISFDTIASLFGFGSNRGSTPFGGTIIGPFVPCTCSFNGFIVGSVVPTPGGIAAPVLFYNFFQSRLFPNFRPRAGRLTLGLHDSRPGLSCRIVIVPPPFLVCIPFPYAATINIIGTN